MCITSCTVFRGYIISFHNMQKTDMMYKAGASSRFSNWGGGGAKVRKISKFLRAWCANLQYRILHAQRAAKLKIEIVYVSSIFMLNLMVL